MVAAVHRARPPAPARRQRRNAILRPLLMACSGRGLAPDREPAPAPDLMALQYAAHLLSRERPLRPGQAASCRGRTRWLPRQKA